MLIILVIALIIAILVLLIKQSSSKERRIIIFRNNVVVGNKCCIVHPENPKKLIEVKITDIKGDIITVEGDFFIEQEYGGGKVYISDKQIPLNEIFPYE